MYIIISYYYNVIQYTNLIVIQLVKKYVLRNALNTVNTE